jgi:cytoplasmic iron level regulating protein YaaA (DUF328/UPF0246 family)
MKILISPAKSIDTTRNFPVPQTSHAAFLKDTEKLVQKLKKMSEKKLGSLMHISPDLAQLNYQRYQDWQLPEEIGGQIIPAGFAFTGEVYKGLEIETLSERELSYAQDNLRILSGLYGILKPLDLLYPYRLEMGTSWAVSPKTKNLYAFWGSKLAAFLNDEMKEAKQEVIINLASTEYFKAIDRKVLKSKVITPVFKEFKNGTYKIVMMYAKHARGAMARYIIQEQLSTPEELKLYTVDGYQFDVNQSSEHEWVFTR